MIEQGLPARRAALSLFQAALSRRNGLEEALSSTAITGLTPLDRGFARQLALTMLRRLGPMDKLLDTLLKKEPPEPARDLMRLGLAQALWLDTPSFAAVDTSVSLAPKPLRGLVNGVLRNALRQPAPADDPESLAPPWLFARWTAAYGEADARAIAGMVPLEPATDVTPRDALDPLIVEGLEAEPLPGGSFRSAKRGDVTAWPGFAEGLWWVQDAAAALPARLLHVQNGETALDLCAAPGGKTLQLAAAGAQVTAVDRAESRLKRLRESLARTGLQAELTAADGAIWADTRLFDVVLLDAPCSATGAFRRHPDILWNAKRGDIASLARVQATLFASAAQRVKPGGRLVYSVCSLEPEEGEAQMRGFLHDHSDFTLDAIALLEAGAPGPSLREEGWLRILPHHLDGGLDGFFVARLRRSV